MPEPPGTLVHLIEPAQWRAALADGAVRPPSLESVGFVHLSTPEQVHLPAQALYPGRRDLVLLVVDPCRLTDPVRFEPGLPHDPASMRFPHLYGPLPVTAVTAVVPYRPPAPTVLPEPGDALGQGAGLLRVPAGPAGGGRGRRPRRGGGAGPGLPALPGQQPAGADGAGGRRDGRDRRRRGRRERRLAAPGRGADVAGRRRRRRRAGAARLEHRGAAAHGPPGRPDRPAPPRAPRWWTSGRCTSSGRTPGGRSWPASGNWTTWSRSWSAASTSTTGSSRSATSSSARTGQVVAAGQLRVDGATAAVDSVLTDPAARGRGHADAVLGRALELAADGRLRPRRPGGGGRRLAAALVRPARLRGGRFGVERRPARVTQTGARTDSSR